MANLHDFSELGFTLSDAADHWEITLTQSCTSDVIHRLIRAMRNALNTLEQPDGILIDLTKSNPVSLVCISNLADSLSQHNLKVAAVFRHEEQYALAQLIHYTLPNRDYVGYFLDHSAALDYLHNTTSETSLD